jgi:hypothetical protein
MILSGCSDFFACSRKGLSFFMKNLPVVAKKAEAIALRLLPELVLALGFVVLCAPFAINGSVIISLLLISVVSIVTNLFLEWLFNEKKQTNAQVLLKLHCNANFYNTTHGLIIHEIGHYSAAKILFQTQPTIQLTGCANAVTRYSVKGLTSLGGFFGYRKSILLVTLAGSGLALMGAAIALIASFCLKNYYPDMSLRLYAYGQCEIIRHAFYALSALWTSPAELAHDFVRLSTFGIHPAAVFVAILGISILCALGYWYATTKAS